MEGTCSVHGINHSFADGDCGLCWMEQAKTCPGCGCRIIGKCGVCKSRANLDRLAYRGLRKWARKRIGEELTMKTALLWPIVVAWWTAILSPIVLVIVAVEIARGVICWYLDRAGLGPIVWVINFAPTIIFFSLVVIYMIINWLTSPTKQTESPKVPQRLVLTR